MAHMITESRPVSSFDGIRLEGKVQAVITQGEVEGLTIEVDEATLPHVKSEVDNGVLVIGLKNWMDYLFYHDVIYARIALKDLADLHISGDSDVKSASLHITRLRIHISGSAEVSLTDLQAQDLEVRISGTGRFILAGKAANQEIQLSGTARYEAEHLECQVADVHVSGSGKVTLNVQEKLTVSVSGSADIRYLGEPKVSQRVSGSASIKKLGV
jgi:hypothetical protein